MFEVLKSFKKSVRPHKVKGMKYHSDRIEISMSSKISKREDRQRGSPFSTF